jgi:hypothetical protein
VVSKYLDGREAQPTKIMGAQKALTLVKNQWRQKTTSSVFLVRIHVCRTIAPAMIAVWRGVQEGRKESSSAMGNSRHGSSTQCTEKVIEIETECLEVDCRGNKPSAPRHGEYAEHARRLVGRLRYP